MTALGNLAFQNRNNSSIGTIGDSRTDSWLLGSCHQKCSSPHRDTTTPYDACTTQVRIGNWAGAQEIYSPKHIALLEVTKREGCRRRFTCSAHVEGQYSKPMTSKCAAEVEESSFLIGTISASTMHHDNGSLRRQVPIRQHTWNVPTPQLHLVYSARKSDILKL